MGDTRLDEQPFAYAIRKDGCIAISHENRSVMVVSSDAAVRLTKKLQGAGVQEMQLALAKITGNFKRGNERAAANHGRNRK